MKRFPIAYPLLLPLVPTGITFPSSVGKKSPIILFQYPGILSWKKLLENELLFPTLRWLPPFLSREGRINAQSPLPFLWRWTSHLHPSILLSLASHRSFNSLRLNGVINSENMRLCLYQEYWHSPVVYFWVSSEKLNSNNEFSYKKIPRLDYDDF